MGSRWLRHCLHHPLADPHQAALRHASVAELLAADFRLPILLRPIADIERITARIALRSARPRDLSALRDSLAALPELCAPLQHAQSPLLSAAATQLTAPVGLTERLQHALRPEPAAVLREGGVIQDGFDARLDELRSLQSNCGDFLLALEVREKERTGIHSLKVEFNKVHGFYIEVSHSHSEKIPDDYRRRQTLKNAERYITPELKAFEDQALSANERALALEKQLYEALLDELAEHLLALQHIARTLALIDGLSAFAEVARQGNYCQPRFQQTPGLLIESGRHPVVETQVAPFIANDLNFSATRRMLLVTGPNMGGKSTYMRQVALIVLLAHCGSFVPANAATIGPIDAIYTRIGASDDLASGRSTFMVEMTEAAAILHGASEKSLVLMDEIGRGTSTFDGMALAFAIARIVFLHAVEEGPASQSYGIQVAALAGIPGSVIRDAKRHLTILENRELLQRANDGQPDLFAPTIPATNSSNIPPAVSVAEIEPHPLLEALHALDPDSLSPREALEALYRLRHLLS